MSKILNPILINGIPELDCVSFFDQIKKYSDLNTRIQFIDVRRPEEFNAELGHIEGAKLIPLGPDLVSFLDTAGKDQEIVFICRSGGRSGSAAYESMRLGFKSTMNMTGGMLAWNALHFPVIKSN